MRRVCLAPGLALALIAAGLAGCPRKPGKTPPPRVVFVLFDVTASTGNWRDQYYNDFRRILDNLKSSDVIVADRITENPLVQSRFRIRETMPSYGRNVNRLLYERAARRVIEKCDEEAKAILYAERSAPPYTRILDALRLAERVYRTYAGESSRKVLVLFSDMIEQSEEYDFAVMGLKEKSVVEIIRREESRGGGLPDLGGVVTYVAGACAADVGGMPSERVLAIENFWMRYFEACGADLARERYGSSLLEFEP